MEQRYALKKSHQHKQKELILLTCIVLFSGLVIAFLLKWLMPDSGLYALIAFITLVSFIGLIVFRIKKQDDNLEEIIQDSRINITKLGLNHEVMLFDSSKNKGLHIDNEKFIFIERKDQYDEFNKISIPFNKILDVTINSNNSSKISVSKGGLIGGSLVGGVLMGGFGAVVGAMGASKSSEEIVNTLDMIITLDDLNSPVIKFNMINSNKGISTLSNEYKSTIDLLDEWFGKFTIILKRNEKNI